MRKSFNAILYGRKLFQQYLIAAICNVESEKIEYVRTHQSDLRAESYAGLRDYLNSEAECRDLQPGRIVIIPPTFWLLRNINQNYLDAMEIGGKFGKTNFFLTFTCNPKWPEITENLPPGLNACNRPDLVSRVFKTKLIALLDDVHKIQILGTTIAYVHVIEFQRRGLPHCHMLINVSNEDKLPTADDIDACISAEISDSNADANVYEIVKSAMVHGPCGHLNPNSPCMKDGVCTKCFPKSFSDNTIFTAAQIASTFTICKIESNCLLENVYGSRN